MINDTMKDLEEESALKASFCQERQKTDIILPIIIISNHQLLIGMLNYHFNHLYSFFSDTLEPFMHFCSHPTL